MPKLIEQIENHMQGLIDNPPKLTDAAHEDRNTNEMRAEAHAWAVSAMTVITVVVKDAMHPYRSQLTLHNLSLLSDVRGTSSKLLALLKRLKADFEAGILSNLEDQVAAQTFDDLLDHALSYLKQKRKDPAGVLTGVVFEDTVRKLCRRNNIPEAGAKLDHLLSALVNANVITQLERKHATAAAGLRTSATHAQWDEFTADDVDVVLRFTRRLILEKLA
jgi:hypothetical protein